MDSSASYTWDILNGIPAEITKNYSVILTIVKINDSPDDAKIALQHKKEFARQTFFLWYPIFQILICNTSNYLWYKIRIYNIDISNKFKWLANITLWNTRYNFLLWLYVIYLQYFCRQLKFIWTSIIIYSEWLLLSLSLRRNFRCARLVQFIVVHPINILDNIANPIIYW